MRRVLHVVETLAPHEGGPPRVVANLAIAQRALGSDAHILCGDGRALAHHIEYWRAHAPGFPAEKVEGIAAHSDSLFARRRSLASWLRVHLGSFDVVHLHQLWRLVPTLTGLACREQGVPYLIAPHTSLSPWALGQKSAKKTLARWLVWDRILRGAAGFHALNELEADELRLVVGAQGPPVYVVANGVSLEEFATPPGASAAVSGLTAPEGAAPFILFLARLHIMKGPDLLVEAFARIAQERPGLRLVFAGPDFGMLDRLQRRLTHYRLAERSRFLGLVSGPERLWLLNNAVCLCQPSRDEGFSLSILEAMACGRPVVISERCKFPEVARHGAGEVVGMGTAELAAALRVYAQDPGRRSRDGQAARALVMRSYTWDRIAKQAQQMYARVACRTPDARAARCDLP
jgi:glycosyltransferase involved in cell wall biosynthesis